MSKEKIYKIGLLMLSLVISLVIVLNKDTVAALAGYGYLGIFLISVLGNATVVIPAPVILTALIGGGVFNPLIVGVVAALGATIGELTGYLAGVGGKVFVDKNKWYLRIEKWIHKDGFLTLFILSAIPNPLFDVAGICAGVTGYPVKKFLISTFFGKTIKFVGVALFGAYFL